MGGEGTKEKILKLLSRHDYGLTIEEIARSLEINRMTASKYLAILEATKKIVVREVGKAKLHYSKERNGQKWLKLNNIKSSCGLNSISFLFLLFLFFTAIIFFSTITTANPNGGNQNFEISVIKDYTNKLITLDIQGPPLTDFSLTMINPENKSISPKDNVPFRTDQEGRYELNLIGFVPGDYFVKLVSNGTEYTEEFEIDPFIESECNRSFLEYRAENATNVTETNESVAGEYVWDICRDFVESSVTEELISEIVENRSFLEEDINITENRTFVEGENVTNETIERSFVEEELNITEIAENRTFLENESDVNETVINETLERSFLEEELNITEIAENRTFVDIKDLESMLGAKIEVLLVGDKIHLELSGDGYKLKLRELKDLSQLKEVKFVRREELKGRKLSTTNKRIVTDILYVNSEVEVETADIVLPKHSRVSKIVSCQDFNPDTQSCDGEWVEEPISFQQNSTHVWFTVTHFTGYGGIPADEYYYVTGTDDYPNNKTGVLEDLSTSRDDSANYIDTGGSLEDRLYTLLNASITNIKGRTISTTDTITFRGYWTLGSSITTADATYRLWRNQSGTLTLICKIGDDSTGGPDISDATLVFGSCSPSSDVTLSTGDGLMFQVNVYVITGGNPTNKWVRLSWDTSTFDTGTNFTATTKTDINVTANQSDYTVNDVVNASGYYFWDNGTMIANKNVTVKFYNVTNDLKDEYNVTTDSSGLYWRNYTIPSGEGNGTWTVNVTGIYNGTINATGSTTFELVLYGTLNVNLTSPPDYTAVTQNTTFYLNVTISCEGATGAICGTVYASAMYNESSANPDKLINITDGATPFYFLGTGTGEIVNFSDGFSPASDAVMGLGYDPTDDTFWLTDTADDYAYHYNKSGSDLGDGYDLGADGLDWPTGVVYDSSDDSYWVADQGATLDEGYIYHYDSTWGDLGDDIDTGAAGAGAVEGIAYDPTDDTLWAVDLLDKFVYHFNASTGANITDGFALLAGMDWASGIAYDPTDDTLWVTDGGSDYMYHLDKDGTNLTDGINVLTLVGSALPEAIGFDTTDNSFWVPDDTALFVYHFGPEGAPAENPQSQTLIKGQTLSANWTVNATGTNNTQYKITVKANSSESKILTNYTNNITVCIGDVCEAPAGDTSPTASLGTNPVVYLNDSDGSLTFDLKCSDDNGVSSLKLYGNWSGWHANETNSSPVNDTFWNVTVNGIPEGVWKWDAWCNDTIGQGDWSTVNRTFTVDLTNPTAEMGTNPVDYINDSDGSITFDLKCSDNLVIDTLQIWGNWSGTWEANQTNSTPQDNTFWNKTVPGIPAGVWKWGVYCNDSSGREDWSTNNRTLTVDLTDPQIGSKYINESGSVSPDTIVCLNVSGISDTYLDTVWTMVTQSNGSVFNITMSDTGSCAGSPGDNWYSVDVNVGDSSGTFYYNTTYVNDSSGRMNSNTTVLNLSVGADTSPTASLGTNPVPALNDSDGSIVFDLKCSDDIGVSALKLWGNWSGWHANQTNSTPANNTFWNITVSGIPEGTWKWDAWCNDTSNNGDWSDVNRTFTVDLTDPQIGSKYINESGTVDTNTVVCLNVSGVSDTNLETVWTTVNQSNGSVFNITMSDTGSCAGSPGDNWYSVNVNVGDSGGTFYYNTTYVNDSSGRMNSNTTVLNLSVVDPSAVEDCTDITSSGVYYLQNNIPSSPQFVCINISVSDVTFDCQGFDIQGQDTAGTYGIYADSAFGSEYQNITIKNCNVMDWWSGIYWDYVDASEIINVTANSNDFYGFYLSWSDNNNLTNNTFNLNDYGIFIGSSTDNTLTNNTASSNDDNGIHLDSSSNNNLTQNNMSNNEYNFYISGSSDSHFNQTIDTTNIVNGKPVYYLLEEQDQEYDESTNAGFFACVFCDNVTARNLELSNNSHGVLFHNTDNFQLINVSASSNDYGVYLSSSSNITLTDNTVSLNTYGVYLSSSSNNNNLTDNTVSLNDYGIFLDSSSDNTLTDNTANSNDIYGISLSSSSDNTLTDNTVSLNTFGVYLSSSSNNNNLTNNTASLNDFCGVCLFSSSNNNLTNNAFSSNRRGVYLVSSSNNNLTRNTVSDNLEDISDNSTNIYFYNEFAHNINNTLVNFSTSNQTPALNDVVKFNISVYYPNGSARTDFSYNITTRPYETVNTTTSGENITGNFTITEVGLYSLIINITYSGNNTVERNYAFFVNATGTGTADYYFRKVVATHGQPYPSAILEDTYTLLSTAPQTEESWTCTSWIQASPDDLEVPVPVIIEDINISVWYKASGSPQFGIQRYVAYDNEVDYNKSVPPETYYTWINRNFSINWPMDYIRSWYWLGVKSTGGNPGWKTNDTDPSYVNITYNYTTTPEIKSTTNTDILILSATSPATETKNATIYLDGTGSTNLTVQMPNTTINYTAKMDGNDCNDANCNLTSQDSGELNLTLTLGSEHNITIGEKFDTSPVASLGTNPVASYGDSDGSIVFDLKCSDDAGADVLELWGNWSGWHANETNSTPGNDAWWNVTVSGIPEGVWKWDAWCNDTINQEDWSAVNRTFTVDLTNPQIGSKYINESGSVDTDTVVCLNISGVSDTHLETVWTTVTQSNGSVFNITMSDTGSCAGIADDGWYSVNVNVGDAGGTFYYNTTYVNDSSGRMNSNTTVLNLTTQDTPPTASLGTNPVAYLNDSDGSIVFDLKCSDDAGADVLQLWGNWSGWHANQTNSSPGNDAWWNVTVSGIPTGTWKWDAWCNDTIGQEDWSAVNRTFTVDLTNPTAEMGTNPPDDSTDIDGNVTFDLKCSDNLVLDTLQLWGNWSGSWEANQTNSTPQNDTFWNITVPGIPEGTYKWGVYCNDSSGRGDWSDSNRTLTSTAVTNCTTITSSGVYYLQNNILNSPFTYCINISTSNVTLDCQGKTIQGQDTVITYGIYAQSSSGSEYQNITIKNCSITDWFYGAYLDYSDNGSIQNITATSNTYGIFLWYSDNNNLTNITANDNSRDGLYMFTSNSNTLINITASNNSWNGLSLTSVSNNQLINSTLLNNTFYDIILGAASDSECNNIFTNVIGTDNKPIVFYNYSVIIEDWDNNVSEIILCNADNSVINNVTMNHTDKENNGIWLERTDSTNITNTRVYNSRNGLTIYDSANNTIITNLTANSNTLDGVQIASIDNINLTNITANDNARYGIYLSSGDNNTLTSITANNNTKHGLYLDSSESNNLSDVTANNNTQYGIYLNNVDSSTLNNITANNNTQYGIYLNTNSNGNVFTNITTNNNTLSGFLFVSSDDNVITNTIANDNANYGIYLFNSDNNTITNSRMESNTNYGVSLNGAGQNDPNKFYNNLFNNTDNIEFVGTTYNNTWNTTNQSGTRVYSSGTNIGGNYWTNSTGNGFSDTCDDDDGDGFCNDAYNVTNDAPCTPYVNCSGNADYLPYSDEYDIPPTASLGTNPVPSYGDSDGSITFDLKCSDDNGVNTLQLWGNWSGWHANETNSSPGNDAWWNVTVSGIPEGMWKWDAWCNDTTGQGNWSDVNRTFTVDLTNPTAEMGTNPVDYVNDSDGSITFDLKCSDNFDVDTLQLYGNWSGWHANETNSSPLNNTFWNVTVPGVPEGTYKWGVYCNDSSGRGDWPTSNRTLTIDLTDPQIGSKYINESGTVNTDTVVCLNVSGVSDTNLETVWTTVNQSNGSVFNITMSDTGSCAGSPDDGWYSVNVNVGDSSGTFFYNTTYVNDSSGRMNTNTTVLNLTVIVPVAPANVVVKTYTNSNYNETDKFYERNDTVFTEANVTNSSGGNITDATVTANFTTGGSVENTTTLTKVCGDCSVYRGTWVTNATQTLGVYLVNVTATNAAGSKTDNNSMHLYSGSGVSAYEMDWDEDGTDDYIMENKHVISVFNKSAEDTNRLLSHVELKDTNVSFTFSDTSDTDSSHRGFIGTDGSKGWNFTNLSFTSTGESLSSVNLTMNAFDPEKPTKPTEQNTDSNALDENPEASGQGIIEIIMNILNEWISVLQGLFQPAIPEHEPKLSALKTYFSQEENPEFVFEIQEAKEVSKSIEVDVYHMGKPVEIEPEIKISSERKLSITVPRARKFRPGLYTIKLTHDGETHENEFLWGVLAINTHKSIYLENEEAFIGIAVLDNEGHMVCDADVTLEITDPQGTKTTLTTSDGTISVSPECEVYGVTNLPDYYAYYTVSTEGTYTMNLKATTEDGERTMTDAFLVQKQVDFDVEREGPTRIYPPAKYRMAFEIKANKDYDGEITEYVPPSFAITPQQGLITTTTGDTKTLTWNEKLTAGETYQLEYEFDAPDVSPYLFTLGALEIGNWKEAREWMIASDAYEENYYIDTYVSSVDVTRENETDMLDGANDDDYGQIYQSGNNAEYHYDIETTGKTGLIPNVNSVRIFISHYMTDNTNDAIIMSHELGSTSITWDDSLGNYPVSDRVDNITITSDVTTWYWENITDLQIDFTTTRQSGADNYYHYIDTVWVEVNYTGDFQNSTASLGTNPTAGLVDTDGSITFDLKCSDDFGVDTLQLWGNWSGGWSAKETNSNPVNDTFWNVTVSGIAEGSWKWDAWCNDTWNNGDWSDVNRTFSVNPPPSVKDVTVTPQQAKNSTTINITANITDTDGVSVAKAMLYYPNGTFWKNATMTNSGDIYYNETVTVNFYPYGNYNVTIWANDTAGSVNSSETTWFAPYLNLSKEKNITINGSFEDWADVTNVSDVVGDSDAPSGTKSLTKNTSYQNNPDITMKEILAPVLNVSQEATINVTINVTNANPSETNGFSWSVNVSLWNTTQLNTLNISTWNQTNVSVSGFVLSVFPSDFDNDGDIDIVSGDWGNRIYILENPGNENSTDITAWNKTSALLTDNVNCIFVADLNNDGYNDIISGDDSIQVYIWENPGNSMDISGWSKTSASASHDVDAVFAADIDNDGDIDILSGDYGQQVYIWENPGNSMDISGWSKTNTPASGYVIGLAAADINNDNYNDIISAEWNNDRIALWINPGNEDSTNISRWIKTSETVGGDGESVAAGDIDNDGDLDIIGGAAGVYIWENPGNEDSTNITRWNYTNEVSYPVRAVAVADLDNDAYLDIISGDTDDELYIQINPGNENSTNISRWIKTNVPSGGSVYSVAAADLDNEGDNDIISVGGTNLVFIRENSDVASTYITSDVKTFVEQWGDVANYSLNWTPGNSGTYELMAIADNTGRHAEVLENNNKIVMEVEVGLVPSDFDLETVSLANNNTYLFAMFAVNGSIDLSTSTRYYGLYISTNGSTGNQTSYGGDATLPFSADYFVMVNGSSDCNVFNSSYDNIGGCNASNSSKQIELRVLLTLINTSIGDNVNITFETGGSSYDFAPDGESFLSYDAPGPPGDQSPTASLGTNPVPTLNDSDGSIVFDLKCSDDNGVSALKLYGNWSGWHANETNSSPASNAWWNVTVNGIPEGVWKWDAWCNDTIGQGDWSAVNRTFTVDLTNPTAEMGTNPVDYINDSDGDITFDLKCSDNFAPDVIQLWGNWSGTWEANQTNSTPLDDTFWNKSVPGIPAGIYKWGVYCNDSSGREDWSTNNRTLTVDLTDPQIGNKYINESGSIDMNVLVCLNVSGVSDNIGVDTVWTTVTQSNGSIFNATMSDTGSCAGSPGDNWYSADVNVGDSSGTFFYNTTYVNDSSGRVNSNTTVLNLTVNPPSFNVTIEMRSEDVDYLVYHWLNFPSGDLGNLWSDVSGRFGSSVGDDRYHVGDGTDQKVEEAAADQWTNYTTSTNKYIAVYDNSTTTDSANNTVLGWVHFKNTSGADYEVVSIWNESEKYGTRIKYSLPSMSGSDKVVYLLVFSNGTWNTIDKWMSTINSGSYPTTNFMSSPGATITALGSFTGPSSINENETTIYMGNCTCSGGSCVDPWIRIQDNRTGGWSDSVTSHENVSVNVTSYSIAGPLSGTSGNYDFNVTGNSSGQYNFRVVCNTTSATEDPSDASLLIVSACNVDFTMTSQLSAGIRFSEQDPSQVNVSAVDNGDYNVTDNSNSGCGTVNVSVRATSDLVNGSSTIGIGNVTVNSTSPDSETIQLSTTYQLIRSSMPAGTSNITTLYFWLTIPSGQDPRDYNTTIYIMEEME